MIRIIYMGNWAMIKFDYNPDIVKIMNQFQGQYYHKTKSWSVPNDKVDELKEELVFNGYEIKEIGNDNYTVKRDATTS